MSKEFEVLSGGVEEMKKIQTKPVAIPGYESSSMQEAPADVAAGAGLDEGIESFQNPASGEAEAKGGSNIPGFEPGGQAGKTALEATGKPYVGLGEVTPEDAMGMVIEHDDEASRNRRATVDAAAPVGTADVVREFSKPEELRPKTEAEKAKEASDQRIRDRIAQLKAQQAALKAQQEQQAAAVAGRKASDASRVADLKQKASAVLDKDLAA